MAKKRTMSSLHFAIMDKTPLGVLTINTKLTDKELKDFKKRWQSMIHIPRVKNLTVEGPIIPFINIEEEPTEEDQERRRKRLNTISSRNGEGRPGKYKK